MSPARSLLVLGLLIASALGGCALTSKANAQPPRFFSPEPMQTAAASSRAPSGLVLRLGQIEAASHLEERMAYRLNDNELGYYDDLRWTEAPEQYLRRALETELFERRGVTRIMSGAGAALDVELTAFEELRAPSPKVRLALRFTLHDEYRSLYEQSVSVERPLPAASDGGVRAPDVARALAEALVTAVAKVGEEVVARLPAVPPLVTPTAAPEPPR